MDDVEEGLVSRRSFVGAASLAGAAALAGAGLVAAGAGAQTRKESEAGRAGNNASDPGPNNKPLEAQNSSSNMPPFTDKGGLPPLWHSFNLVHKRVQAGGWTRQVTVRELPSAKDLAGVNMRLTAGSFRELHWHVSDEWAIMLAGRARVTLMQPDGKMFIDDLVEGDLWYFPAGYPHSIQGLAGDGCEFLLVFNDGNFSEDETFLLSEQIAHTAPDLVAKNMGWTRAEWDQVPATQLYIFPAELPDSLEADQRFLGAALETEKKYTFHGTYGIKALAETAGGSARVVDSRNFPVAREVASAVVTLKPGAVREMHWHPNVPEWQYWIKGKGRMTVVTTEGKARTMDFAAGDVGFVPLMAGHVIENTGTEDCVFLEMFKAGTYEDVSMNQWIARMPTKMAKAHLKMEEGVIRRAPQGKRVVLPG